MAAPHGCSCSAVTSSSQASTARASSCRPCSASASTSSGVTGNMPGSRTPARTVRSNTPRNRRSASSGSPDCSAARASARSASSSIQTCPNCSARSRASVRPVARRHRVAVPRLDLGVQQLLVRRLLGGQVLVVLGGRDGASLVDPAAAHQDVGEAGLQQDRLLQPARRPRRRRCGPHRLLGRSQLAAPDEPLPPGRPGPRCSGGRPLWTRHQSRLGLATPRSIASSAQRRACATPETLMPPAMNDFASSA